MKTNEHQAEELLRRAKELTDRATALLQRDTALAELEERLAPESAWQEGDVISWAGTFWGIGRRYRWAAVRCADGRWATTGRAEQSLLRWSDLLAKILDVQTRGTLLELCYVSEWTVV